MAPSRVDPNKKQAKASINQVEQDSFHLNRMGRSVNPYPSQATVNYANKTSCSGGEMNGLRTNFAPQCPPRYR